MPSEMVERAAKALRANSHFCTMAEDAGLGDAAFIRWSVEIARAAIAPMLEPTEAMVDRGAAECGTLGAEDSAFDVAKWCWQAMIYAALDEKANPDG